MSLAPLPSRPDLTCADVEALLPLIADGVLAPEDDPALFEHLARCPDCQASLAGHDLIELALSHGTPPASAKIIRFQRLHWSAAALWLLCAGGLGAAAWWMQGAAPAAPVPTAQVIEEVPPGNLGERAFLLRVGDEVIETRADDDAIAPGQLPRLRRADGSSVPVHVKP